MFNHRNPPIPPYNHFQHQTKGIPHPYHHHYLEARTPSIDMISFTPKMRECPLRDTI